MQPTVSRTVHYVSHGTPIREDGTQAYPKACRAAIVTQVHEPMSDDDEPGRMIETIGLCVLNPTGLFFHEYVVADQDEKVGGTWHWPERADAPVTTEVTESSIEVTGGDA